MTAPRKPSEILEAAGDLLAMPGAWTQGAMARNAGGQETGLSEYRGPAVCWCATGATGAIAYGEGDDQADEYLRKAIGQPSIVGWNDAIIRTQSEVVAAFRKAAALAREAGE